MRPGSLPWLLRHELRVRWREALGDTKPGTALFLGALVLVAAHLFLAPLAEPLAGIVASPRSLPATLLAGVALLVLVPMGLTVGINHSVMALFERGDLDLLASSPLRARTVFASRLLAVAAGVFLTLGVFVLPLVTLGLYVGAPRLLGAVPLLASVALTTASLGMLLTLALVRALGPRRARTLSQVLAALAGAFLFLLTQLPNLMRGRTDEAERLQRWLSYLEPGGPLAADSPLWLPARTLYLDPLSTVVSLGAGALLAWGTVVTLHGAFARGIGLSEGTPRRRRARDEAVPRFAGDRGPVRALLAKEWKLILRDPYLVSQTLLQLVYLAPAAYVLFFSDRGPWTGLQLGPLAAALVATAGGTLASSLARICVAGEEAPDLLAASPVPGRTLRRAKLLASSLPALALCAVLAVGVGTLHPLAGVAAAACGAACTLTVSAVRLWNPVRASRKDLFRQRRVQGDLVLSMVEGLVPIVWGVACFLLATLDPWAVVALAAACGLPLFGFLRARGQGFAFGT